MYFWGICLWLVLNLVILGVDMILSFWRVWSSVLMDDFLCGVVNVFLVSCLSLLLFKLLYVFVLICKCVVCWVCGGLLLFFFLLILLVVLMNFRYVWLVFFFFFVLIDGFLMRLWNLFFSWVSGFWDCLLWVDDGGFLEFIGILGNWVGFFEWGFESWFCWMCLGGEDFGFVDGCLCFRLLGWLVEWICDDFGGGN